MAYSAAVSGNVDVGIGTGRQQARDDFRKAAVLVGVEAGFHQCGPAQFILGVDLGARFQQGFHHFQAAAVRGIHQRRGAIGIARVDVRALGKQFAYACDLSGIDGFDQLLAH